MEIDEVKEEKRDGELSWLDGWMEVVVGWVLAGGLLTCPPNLEAGYVTAGSAALIFALIISSSSGTAHRPDFKFFARRQTPWKLDKFF